MKKSIVFTGLILSATLLIGGCARNISSNSYDARTIGASNRTYVGTIVSVRNVAIDNGDNLEDNKTGGLMGAVAGGAIGNAFGGGRGRNLSTAAGVLGGAVAGAYAEKKMKEQNGLEIIVKIENSNEMRTIIQGNDVYFSIGQPVYLILDDRGRSRIVSR